MHFLTWDHKKQPDNPEAAQYFVVYRFRKGEKVDIGKAENILDVTPDNSIFFPTKEEKTIMFTW